MSEFDAYLARKRRELGDKFDPSGLSAQFIPFYNSEQRIKVQTVGLTLTGTIGTTTGWRPCFLLMRTRRAIGSSWTLSDKDKIVAVQRGRTYVPFPHTPSAPRKETPAP